MWSLQLSLVLWSLQSVLAARILGVFPVPSISHQVVFQALTNELARRGHELVVLTTDLAHTHPNITEIDVHDISYKIWTEQCMSKIFEAERAGKRSILNQYKFIMDALLSISDAQLAEPEVQSSILKKKEGDFDLILLESHIRPFYALRHKFKVPIVAVSSMGPTTFTSDALGISSHPLMFPDPLVVKYTNPSLFDRMIVLYHHIYKLYFNMQLLDRSNKIVQKYFSEDTPSIDELESETDLLILNVNPIWDGIKVTSPNIIYMWGTHLKPPKELPVDLNKFLDDSARGVVYMSLGSNMKSSELSAERLRVLVEAFRRLPYDVLWKWETDELPDRPNNVRIAKWLPQADLLRHANVKAFITQGGVQSTDEALRAGVPLIGIPMLGDQESNVQKYVQHGVGIALDIKSLTADQLVSAVKSVVQDEKYRAAVRRMALLMADGDVAGGVEHAAWWVEYVLRHGDARHLRSPAAGVSIAEYFMLDVLAVLGLTISIGIFVIFSTLCFIFSKFCRTWKLTKLKDQ